MPKDDPARGNPVSEDAFDELEKMLASLFGEQMASDAVSALRSSGVDPSSIAQMPGVGDISQLSPAQLLRLQAYRCPGAGMNSVAVSSHRSAT